MANGKSTITTFDQYKHLTDEEKAFYTFDQLRKIDDMYMTVKQLDDRYALKRIERIVYGFIGLVLVAFAGAVINGVIPTV